MPEKFQHIRMRAETNPARAAGHPASAAGIPAPGSAGGQPPASLISTVKYTDVRMLENRKIVSLRLISSHRQASLCGRQACSTCRSAIMVSDLDGAGSARQKTS